jgi:hypothetical protein
MQQSIDLPLPHVVPGRVDWRFADGHLVVRGERLPYDHLADPDARRPEWFERRIRLDVMAPAVLVQLITAPDGPHLLVGWQSR